MPLAIPNSEIQDKHVSPSAAIQRSKHGVSTLQPFLVSLLSLRIWDALFTLLSGTPATDDLGLIGGAFGTNSPTVQTGDLKAAGSTDRRARFSFQLPDTYEAGGTVTARIHAGMKTTVADTSASVDLEIFKSNKEEGIGADLVTTGAQSINSLVFNDDDFALTATGLNPGDVLDCRITVDVNDAATATAVIGVIGSIEFLLDTRG